MTGKGGNIISLLRGLVKNVNELLEETMADVTAEQAHRFGAWKINDGICNH